MTPIEGPAVQNCHAPPVTSAALEPVGSDGRAPAGRRAALRSTTSVSTSEPLVALTFDDGPDERLTPDVLDVLARRGVRATFFLVAERARDHPELARQVADAGHEIGLHGDRHVEVRGTGSGAVPGGAAGPARPGGGSPGGAWPGSARPTASRTRDRARLPGRGDALPAVVHVGARLAGPAGPPSSWPRSGRAAARARWSCCTTGRPAPVVPPPPPPPTQPELLERLLDEIDRAGLSRCRSASSAPQGGPCGSRGSAHGCTTESGALPGGPGPSPPPRAAQPHERRRPGGAPGAAWCSAVRASAPCIIR